MKALYILPLIFLFFVRAIAAETESTPIPEIPDIWPGTYEELCDQWARLEKGQSRILGESAGGHPIWVVTYGEKEPVQRTANFSSALASKMPSALPERNEREKPVLLIIGPVHGGENEGVFGIQSLLSLMETGRDLYGQAQPDLKVQLESFRLVIIPILNPDGYIRFDPPQGRAGRVLSLEEYAKWVIGLRPDGEIAWHPTNKATNPFPQHGESFLGGYYNDNGINLDHDDFFGTPQPETRLLFELLKEELPTVAVTLHTCPIASIWPTRYIPVEHQLFVEQTGKDFDDRMKRLGIPTAPLPSHPRETEAKGESMKLTSAIYHTSGTYSLLFEAARGGPGGSHLLSFEEIHATQMALFEAVAENTARLYQKQIEAR